MSDEFEDIYSSADGSEKTDGNNYNEYNGQNGSFENSGNEYDFNEQTEQPLPDNTEKGFGNNEYNMPPVRHIQSNGGYNPQQRPYNDYNPYNINQNGYNDMRYNPYNPNNFNLNNHTYNQNNFSYQYQPDMNNNGKPPKKHNGMKVALWCVSSVLLVVIVALVIFILNPDRNNNSLIDDNIPNNSGAESSYGTASSLPDAPDASADENGPQISAEQTSYDETSSALTANNAYKKASPSVVCITSYEAGTDYTLTESGEGSGIIISSDGYIATNSHVVDDSKDTGVMVTLSTGKQYLGTIIGIDKKTDLAVIKIDADSLTEAAFADSDNLVVGQEAYAIGNPGGAAFSNSLTKGAVSALNRVLSSNRYVKYIQTDAAINPGNSGGALINEHGQVIGMNTAKLVGTDYEGMGFAIPSNTVIEIVNKLIKYGYVNDRGTLGIEGTTCTLYASKTNNIPQGMIITKINRQSSLYGTIAKEKDIITAINGKTIKDATEFVDEMKQYKPGDKITLTLFRSYENTTGEPYSYNIEAVLIDDRGE